MDEILLMGKFLKKLIKLLNHVYSYTAEFFYFLKIQFSIKEVLVCKKIRFPAFSPQLMFSNSDTTVVSWVQRVWLCCLLQLFGTVRDSGFLIPDSNYVALVVKRAFYVPNVGCFWGRHWGQHRVKISLGQALNYAAAEWRNADFAWCCWEMQ